MSTAAIVGGSIAAGVGGAAIASHGANQAADTQATAATTAEQLQHQDQQDALNFQKQQYDTEQSQIAPYLKAGTTALGQLNGGSLPGFQAPTNVTEQNDPGYQFRLQQGQQALENSAAAKGGLLTGNTGEALENYGQNFASNEYSNVYNRAMNDYNTNVLGPYNRLSSLAGVGQQAQASGAAQGQQAASNTTNIDLTGGAQQGQDINNAAAAQASGYVGSANAYGSALSGAGNNLTQAYLLSQLSRNFGSQYGLTGTVPDDAGVGTQE